MMVMSYPEITFFQGIDFLNDIRITSRPLHFVSPPLIYCFMSLSLQIFLEVVYNEPKDSKLYTQPGADPDDGLKYKLYVGNEAFYCRPYTSSDVYHYYEQIRKPGKTQKSFDTLHQRRGRCYKMWKLKHQGTHTMLLWTLNLTYTELWNLTIYFVRRNFLPGDFLYAKSLSLKIGFKKNIRFGDESCI